MSKAEELGVAPADYELVYDWTAMLEHDLAEATEIDLHAAVNSVSAKINAVYPALEAGEVVSFSLDDLGGTLLTFSENERRMFLNMTAAVFNASIDGPARTAEVLRAAITRTREEGTNGGSD